MPIVFPETFPTIDQMKSTLQKTVEKSWQNELSADDIDNWLSNFTGIAIGDEQEERRLAMWLLCNFTFFSSNEINHQCRILNNMLIHDLVIENSICPQNINDLMNNVFFSSVGSASESGGLLLYHYRQEANLPLNHFFYPSIESEKIYNENNTLVFLDDAILSGGTAIRNFHEHINKKWEKCKSVYYLTIVASQEGIRKIKEGLPDIHVIYCNRIDERNKCFSDSSLIYYRYKGLLEPSKQIAEFYGSKLVEGTKNSPLGYKDGQYCFGFYYNVPNNVLPIFWSDKNWFPIFKRKEKYQNERQIASSFGKYI